MKTAVFYLRFLKWQNYRNFFHLKSFRGVQGENIGESREGVGEKRAEKP
jgi:hypothetical protein